MSKKNISSFAILVLAIALVLSPAICHETHAEEPKAEHVEAPPKTVAFFKQKLTGKPSEENSKSEPASEKKEEKEEKEEDKNPRKQEIL